MTLHNVPHRWVALPNPVRPLGAPFYSYPRPIKYRCQECGKTNVTAKQIEQDINPVCKIVNEEWMK